MDVFNIIGYDYLITTKNGEYLKINKSILVGILLLTILFMGAVSAAEEYNVAATNVAAGTGDYILKFSSI